MEKVMTQKLRNWLQRQPHPAKLRTDGGDVLILKGRNKWHDALCTIDDLGPAVLEALDDAGNVLRTYRLQDDDSKGVSERKTEDATVALSRVMMEVGDQAARRAIEAADAAAERYSKGYEAAFSAMAQITEMNIKRLTRLESLYMALVRRHAETIEDTADALADAAHQNEDGDLTKMATSMLLQKALGGSAGPIKPNGKKRAADEDDA